MLFSINLSGKEIELALNHWSLAKLSKGALGKPWPIVCILFAIPGKFNEKSSRSPRANFQLKVPRIFLKLDFVFLV